MNRPYITCYMATSIDGRIDCPMTEKLPGLDEYYSVLCSFNFGATLSGRVTAELEIAEKGKFIAKDSAAIGEEESLNNLSGKPIEVIVDTLGTLLWKDADCYEEDYIIITSQKVSKEYLNYLKGKKFSYIVVGEDKIDLGRAVEILYAHFNIKTLGVVGGPKINTAFLDGNLLDEIVVFIGAGIDGRASFPTLFQRDSEEENTFRKLQLESVKSYPSGGVLIRYKVK